MQGDSKVIACVKQGLENDKLAIPMMGSHTCSLSEPASVHAETI